MECSNSAVALSAGMPTATLGFGERTFGLTMELGPEAASRQRAILQQQQAGHQQSTSTAIPMSGNSDASNHNRQPKQCRSICDMDVDLRDDGRVKLARTDSYLSAGHQLDISSRSNHSSMHISAAGGDLVFGGGGGGGSSASLVRSNSMISDGRLGCSPANSSTVSDGALLSAASDAFHHHHHHPLALAEHSRQLARSDSLMAAGYNVRSLYQHPVSASFSSLHAAGLPLSMSSSAGREVSNMNMGMQVQQQPQQEGLLDRGGSLFTPGQLRELQHQALVLKYIMSGVGVPAELVNPIRSSLISAALSASTAHTGLANIAWGGGGYRLGFGASTDPEPHRCRRTDGKKWRCARDVVPDQKYCERHMHRGRHRARKAAADQNSATSTTSQIQAAISGSSANSPAVMAAGSSGNSLSVVATSPRVPSGILPSAIAINHAPQQQPQQQLGMRSLSVANSPAASSTGISVGSSLAASQYPVALLQASPTSAGAAALSSRYPNGIVKSELDLGAEQMFFAEATGSSRGMGHDQYQIVNGLSMLSSINSWRSMQSKPPASATTAALVSKAASPPLNYSTAPAQMRTLHGQDFGLMSEMHHQQYQTQQQHQHHHAFIAGGGGYDVVREPESQPLRHFFDDWPRAREVSWSDVAGPAEHQDEKPSRVHSSTTQLSISIPAMQAASSDHFSANSGNSPRGKLTLSPLKLSMSRVGSEEHDPLGAGAGVDATLGMGMGLGLMNDDRHPHHHDHHHHHRQHLQTNNWIPIAWETPVGGPLAEVLQSSTPRESKSSGLNLMTDGWDSSPRDSPPISSPATTERESVGRAAGSALESSKSAE